MFVGRSSKSFKNASSPTGKPQHVVALLANISLILEIFSLSLQILQPKLLSPQALQKNTLKTIVTISSKL